jgi:hypothetical protein
MNTLRPYQNEGFNLYRQPLPLYCKIAEALFSGGAAITPLENPSLTYPNIIEKYQLFT